MTHDPHHLTGAYAAGALSDAERAEVEAHLLDCADCAREVADLREALAELSVLAESEPPPELRASVLSAISTVRPLPPEVPESTVRPTGPAPTAQPTASEPAAPVAPTHSATVTSLSSRRRARTWLASVAAVAALIVGGLVWQPWADRTGTTTAQSVLDASDARTWSAPVGAGRATVAHSSSLDRTALVLDGMSAPPANKVYQAWLQHRDGTMTSAGLVPPTTSGRALLVLSGDASDAIGVGLSVEPASGSEQPTTDPLVLVALT